MPQAALERLGRQSPAPSPGCRRWRSSWRYRRPWCPRRSPPRCGSAAAGPATADPECGAPRARRRTRAPAPRAAGCRGTRESTRARARMACVGASVQAASMLSMIRHGASWPRALALSLRRNVGEQLRIDIADAARRAQLATAQRPAARRPPGAHTQCASAGRSSASASMRPSSSARAAGICAPLVIASSAAAGPARRVKRCVPPAPGISPSFTSGSPTLRVAPREPPVTGERQLEAAAECHALDGRHERLAECLHARLHLARDGGFEHRARGDFAYVGAGGKIAVGAGEHHGAHRLILRGAPERLQQAGTHRERQRIDRRIVEREDGNAILEAIMHGGHGRALYGRVRVTPVAPYTARSWTARTSW